MILHYEVSTEIINTCAECFDGVHSQMMQVSRQRPFYPQKLYEETKACLRLVQSERFYEVRQRLLKLLDFAFDHVEREKLQNELGRFIRHCRNLDVADDQIQIMVCEFMKQNPGKPE